MYSRNGGRDMEVKMYKYFFVMCVLVPLEIYGYSLAQTDIDKIKRNIESAYSSICSRACQHIYKQSEEASICARACLHAIVNRAINSMKFNAEKFKKSSLNRCTIRIKITLSEKVKDPKEFNKLVQKCIDQEVSQVMTEAINDYPAMIQQAIQTQGGAQGMVQLMLKNLKQETTKSSTNSQ